MDEGKGKAVSLRLSEDFALSDLSGTWQAVPPPRYRKKRDCRGFIATVKKFMAGTFFPHEFPWQTING